jgi:diguanylate cyclase (GGDEF)-like protein
MNHASASPPLGVASRPAVPARPQPEAPHPAVADKPASDAATPPAQGSPARKAPHPFNVPPPQPENIFTATGAMLDLMAPEPDIALEAGLGRDPAQASDLSALRGLVQDLQSEAWAARNSAGAAAIKTLGAHLGNIMAEDALAPGVKPLLRRLQAPLLKVAAAEPVLFQAESHPALEILNHLDQLALATNAKGEIENPRLRESLQRMIERVAQEGAANPKLLREAQEHLGQLIAPLRQARIRRIERVREVCEGSQRVASARLQVDQEIRARVEGKLAPTIALTLLDAGWRQLLMLSALRQGVGGPAWNRQLDVLDRLLAWLEPEAAPPPLREAHNLIAYVDESLSGIGLEHSQLRALIGQLEALLPTDAPTPKRKPEYKLVPATGQPPETALDARQQEALKPLQIGQWFRFALQAGQPMPLCLAWIGENPVRYVFVNRKGIRETELSPATLADYLLAGTALAMENLELPLMERTAQSLVETMRSRLRHQSTHDDVTGLINRREFLWQLRKQLSGYEQAEPSGAVCWVELIHYRKIVQLYGTEAGDAMLREGAAVLGLELEASDILARMGDNSFALLLGPSPERQARDKGEAILKTLVSRRIKYDNHSYALDANMGMALLASAGGDADALVKYADAACLAAKLQSPNFLQVYAEDDARLKKQQVLMNWAGRLDRLLEENQLFARCQMIAPLFPVRDAHVHFEILLGVRDEEGRVVSPFELILAAEQWQRISEIDSWQILAVFGWIRQNPESFAKIGGFSINLSGQSLLSESFLAFLREQLEAAEFQRDKIIFEITETAAIENYGPIDKFMRQIRRYGCKFSLDDFGSGYSSYAYLKNMRVDYLKIDGAFVKELATNPADYAMVKSMNEVAHSLGMKTIAEFVDSAETVDKLREIGVDFAQGYRIHKPAPLAELFGPSSKGEAGPAHGQKSPSPAGVAS